MFYQVNAYGVIWDFCRKYLPVAILVAVGLAGGLFFFVSTSTVEDDDAATPVYDATCTDVASKVQLRCNNASRDDAACTGLFDRAYAACREDVNDGLAVRFEGHRFVPATDLSTPHFCDCTHAVQMAVAATVERCSQVLDCKNEDLHPDRCSEDCKYHAIEGAFRLGPHDTDPEWAPYATEFTGDHEDDAP